MVRLSQPTVSSYSQEIYNIRIFIINLKLRVNPSSAGPERGGGGGGDDARYASHGLTLNLSSSSRWVNPMYIYIYT